MTGKIGMVGAGDAIAVFKAAGVETYPAHDPKSARAATRKAAKECKVIFVTEELYKANADFMKRFDEEPYPAIVSIPSGEASGYGYEVLKEFMEKALGVDILFDRD